MLFTGKNELSIDAKQRLAIPAKIRAQLHPKTDGEAFYVTRGPNGVLWLWTERMFERVSGQVEPTLTPPTDLMDFDQTTFPEAQRVELDTAGRIRLPQELLDQAGLGSTVLLLGMRFHMEIWDREAWEANLQQKQSRRSDIAQRASRYNIPGLEADDD